MVTSAISKGIEEPIFLASIGVLRAIPISIIWNNWYRNSPFVTDLINEFKESGLKSPECEVLVLRSGYLKSVLQEKFWIFQCVDLPGMQNAECGRAKTAT